MHTLCTRAKIQTCGIPISSSHSLPLEAMHGDRFHSSACVKKEHKYEGNRKKEAEEEEEAKRKVTTCRVASLPADPPHA